MSVLGRLMRAARGAFSGWLGRERVVGATVRQTETHAQNRYAQYAYKELVQRYSGYVKVAVSRNGAAVAGLPVRVYRRKRAGDGRTLWKSRGVDDRRRDVVLRGACFQVQRAFEADADMEEITDPMHPLVSLLRRPNPRESGFDFIEASIYQLDLTGNDYKCCVKGQSVPWPTEAWTLQSQYSRVVPDRDSFIKAIIYGTAFENEQTFPFEQIVHTRNPNPLGDPYYGMGCLAAAVVQADLMTAFAQHALASLDNGAQPGLVINSPGSDEKERAQAELQINRKARGISKAARTLILGLGEKASVLKWETTAKEISFLQSARDLREVIANVFDLPVALLTLDTSALATAAAAIPFWHEMGILPRKRRIEASLNDRLVPMFAELGEDLFVVLDPPMGDKRKEEVDEAIRLKDAGIISAVAAAERLGEDVDDVPIDVVTLEAEQEAAPPAPVFEPARASGVVDVLVKVKDGALDPDAAVAVLVSMFSVPEAEARQMVDGQTTAREEAKAEQAEIGSSSGKEEAEDGDPKPEERSVLVSSLWNHRVTRDHDQAGPDAGQITLTESQLRAALRRWFNAFTGTILDGVDAETGEVQDTLGTSRAAADAYNEATGGPLGRISVVGHNRGTDDLAGEGVSMPRIQALNDEAVAVLRRRGDRVVASIGRTLTDKVRLSIAEGIEAGETQPQLIERVKAITSGEVADYAAERIARTEAVRAYSTARRDVWRESGIVKAREWLLSGDPCPLCVELARRFKSASLDRPLVEQGGSVVAPDGTRYTFDYDDLDGPPGHPGCRCAEGMVLK